MKVTTSKHLKKLDIDFNFVQDNQSSSAHGVIRGLHYQLVPFAQTKLVRVLQGEIYDVAVDLRKGSSTYGKWYGIELTCKNKLQLLIPQGFAHGFSVLSSAPGPADPRCCSPGWWPIRWQSLP